MSHSLLYASCSTHLKIVSVALVAGMLVMGVGIKARMSGALESASGASHVVVKAGKPAVYTQSGSWVIH